MLKLFKVTGDSLTPEYQNGDFVLVSKIPFLFTPPSIGDVVAFRQSGYGMLIKRIDQITGKGEVSVIGTHAESVDSREFGVVKMDAILGKVIWHIRKP